MFNFFVMVDTKNSSGIFSFDEKVKITPNVNVSETLKHVK